MQQYRHYEGDLCLVLFETVHTETGETLVIYSHKPGILWAQPAITFYGEVQLDDGQVVKRFEPIEEATK